MSTDWINVSDITPRIGYTATASQTAFVVPFVFFEDEDLKVYQNTVLLTLATHYTVTGAESETGGSVTLLTGATAGDAIMIVRHVAIEQTTHIPPSGPLDVPAINVQISKLIAIDQQLDDGLARSLRLPDSADVVDGLQTTAPVAGEFLKWNATENGVESAAVVTSSGSFAVATQSEAEAGVINTALMTPLRTKQAFDAVFDPAFEAAMVGVQQFNVKQFGALGNGTNDDSAAFASAIAALAAVGGGHLDVPAGFYLVSSGVTVTGNVILRGAGRVSTWLYRRTDNPVLTLSASGQNSAEHLAVMGYGAGPLDVIYGETTFAAALVNHALVMSSNGGFLRDIQVQGGCHALFMDCIDSIITNVDCSFSYGSSNVFTSGANWHYRCKWDNGGQIAATNVTPYSTRASLTAVVLGHVVKLNSFLLICSVAGTTGASPPALRNYGFNIVDGTVTWRLLSPETYYGLYITGTGENHFHQVDLSGSGSYAASLVVDMTPGGSAATVFESGVVSDVIDVINGDWVNISNCEMGSSIILSTGFTGHSTIVNNWTTISAAFNIVVGANVSNFIISNNHMRSGTITVAAGTSDRYVIIGNVRTTVTDGGTGLNKYLPAGSNPT